MSENLPVPSRGNFLFYQTEDAKAQVRVLLDRGTQFRRWATETLPEFLVKGFVLDDERLTAR